VYHKVLLAVNFLLMFAKKKNMIILCQKLSNFFRRKIKMLVNWVKYFNWVWKNPRIRMLFETHVFYEMTFSLPDTKILVTWHDLSWTIHHKKSCRHKTFLHRIIFTKTLKYSPKKIRIKAVPIFFVLQSL
jgi:hypothetical protein